MYGSENSTCLSRGMSTPAIRAIVLLLALALLVALVRADHAQHPVPPDDLALVAPLLDRRRNLHRSSRHRFLTEAVGDSSPAEVVRAQFHQHAVAEQDAD